MVWQLQVVPYDFDRKERIKSMQRKMEKPNGLSVRICKAFIEALQSQVIELPVIRS
jgi:hypothetical protein